MQQPTFKFDIWQQCLMYEFLQAAMVLMPEDWPPREKWLQFPGLCDYEIELTFTRNDKFIRIVFEKPVDIDGEVSRAFRYLPASAPPEKHLSSQKISPN